MGRDQPRNPEGIVTSRQSQEAILAVFEAADPCEPFDAGEIADRAGIGLSTARKHLPQLADEGTITRKPSPESRWVAWYLSPEQDERVEVRA
jgi:DNA-binding MarR family transcriptional regulator